MKKIGKTYIFELPPLIIGSAGVAGKKEGEGPLGDDFDMVFEDTTMGQDSFELAESAMLHDAIIRALESANVSPKDVDFVMTGDLLDQCTGSCFALKDLEMPFIGMYGACSTMALTLCNSAMLVSAGANICVAGASSHFASSERQFRYPLEYGGQRPPTAQWTVTGAGCAVVQNQRNIDPENLQNAVKISAVHIGTITDLGIKDANNMGAAMAPAAARTIADFLHDTQTKPEDYDLILTGDLGLTGSKLLFELLQEDSEIDIETQHKDCGTMIFNLAEQDVNSGGSGCGCSASVFCSHIMKNIKNGTLKKVLFVATGALMSPTSTKQGQSIPGIAHAVLLEK
ncbi:stage V sporulation protein AD [Eubacterium coprostanoligenes]|uniref:Stage V sporulation protein AD n=1 Tax=Eubacterium coprostanoligenes TaxID=290054 RepID=A0A1T4KDT1_9FIRM|nr:stage V sporulation protein AD [Eubacterium coprostanoligenes]SJZ40546.1 stage V sporulation protein AD [Eubacterium coprostanoligenes]